MKICAVIAASEQHQGPDSDFLKQILFQLYYDYGIRRIISGLRPGAELESFGFFLSRKQAFPGLTVDAVFTHEEEANCWPEREREKLFGLIARCDRELILKPVFENGKEFQRNIVMMDMADLILLLGDDINSEFWARKITGSVLKANPQNSSLIPSLTLYRGQTG